MFKCFLLSVLFTMTGNAFADFEAIGKSRGSCSEGADFQKARAAVQQEATRICGTAKNAYRVSNYSESSDYEPMRCPPGHFNIVDVEVIISRAMFNCI